MLFSVGSAVGLTDSDREGTLRIRMLPRHSNYCALITFFFFFFSIAQTRSIAVAAGTGLRADSSVAKEGSTALTLRCAFSPPTLGPNDTVDVVRWSKMTAEHESVLVFEKRLTDVAPSSSGRRYSFFGSWRDRHALHDVTTLADVTLRGKDVTRDDAGVYRCDVTNAGGVTLMRDDTVVTVLYGPGTTTRITSRNGTFRLGEGDTITMSCKADCRPACSFRWTCSGCVGTRAATLTVSRIQRDQSGVYTCLAYNSVSRGRADVTLEVTFPAYIKEMRFPGEEGRSVEVAQGRSVSISCQATGNPPPRDVTWSVLSGGSKVNKTLSMRYGHDESSVLMLPAAGCHDNDEYTCTTTNGLGQPHAQSVLLQVPCAPVKIFDSCGHENATQTPTLATTTNILACVIARPRPTVTWHYVTVDATATVLTEFDVFYDDVTARLETRLSVGSLDDDSSVGVYRVVLENDMGTYSENFTIETREIALKVSFNISIVNVTMTSFCVTWVIGRRTDKADVRTFLLAYCARADQHECDDDMVTHTVTTGKHDDVISHCVTELRPSTLYDVILSLENDKSAEGKNGSLVVFNVTTNSEVKHEAVTGWVAPWQEVGLLLGVLSLVLGLLVLACLAARRRLLVRRRHLDTRQKEAPPPLCICNENVRLSYLEDRRESSLSYTDARSCRPGDDRHHTADTGHSPPRSSTTLRVDHLTRRPSSTPSENIYLDILGDPSTYINQADTDLSISDANGSTVEMPYEIPVPIQPTSANNRINGLTVTTTESDQDRRRLQHLCQTYMDMTNSAATQDDRDLFEDDVRGTSTDDVRGKKTDDVRGMRTDEVRDTRTDDVRGTRTDDFRGISADDHVRDRDIDDVRRGLGLDSADVRGGGLDTDDVRGSAAYDDAWSAALPDITSASAMIMMQGMTRSSLEDVLGTREKNNNKTKSVDVDVAQTRTRRGRGRGGASSSAVTTTTTAIRRRVPTILVSDCTNDDAAPADARHDDDDDHVYDVIRDSDVEDG